jgi:hypothetical protein
MFLLVTQNIHHAIHCRMLSVLYPESSAFDGRRDMVDLDAR